MCFITILTTLTSHLNDLCCVLTTYAAWNIRYRVESSQLLIHFEIKHFNEFWKYHDRRNAGSVITITDQLDVVWIMVHKIIRYRRLHSQLLVPFETSFYQFWKYHYSRNSLKIMLITGVFYNYMYGIMTTMYSAVNVL